MNQDTKATTPADTADINAVSSGFHDNVNKIALGVVLVILVVAGVIAFYIYQRHSLDRVEGVSRSPAAQMVETIHSRPFADLSKNNPDFIRAESLRAAGQYKEAIVEYQKALAAATSDDEKSNINFRIAVATYSDRQPIQSIQLIKALVEATSTTSHTKANALQFMGLMFYQSLDPKLIPVILSGDPYRTFLKPQDNGDVTIALRRLFEYATTYYPLAVSELYSAEWYAKYLINTKNVDTNTRDSFMKIIQSRVAIAGEDINYMKQVPELHSDYALALYRRAVVVGYLYILGDKSSDPEPLYKEALKEASLNIDQEWGILHNYALFLAQAYGGSRKDDIVKILSNFYTNEDFKHSIMVGIYTNAANQKGDVHNKIALLASFDPKFKLYLQTLGWKF